MLNILNFELEAPLAPRVVPTFIRLTPRKKSREMIADTIIQKRKSIGVEPLKILHPSEFIYLTALGFEFRHRLRCHC